MSTQHDPEAPVLRLRITHITSTMSPPLPTLQSAYHPPHLATAVPLGMLPHHAPVVRIFGTTPSLQKICANIHLCYPYFFVPFPMDSQDPLRPERVIKLCQRFAVSLNHAICLAMRQNPTGGNTTAKYGGGSDPKHLHVASVMLVKGTPFYGYHIGYSYFLKVSLINPSRIYVALEQLRKPVVLGREWQPHEAHMNHVLQFMCDFDLYGCGWLDLGGGTFREPLPEGDPYASPEPSGVVPNTFNSLTVPEHMLYPMALSPPKDTFTPLEIDVLPHHILNRRRLKPRSLHADFVELLHRPLDPDEKLVPAVAELWEDERRRRANKGLSLSEKAMMPGSGGMGGRSKAELGYLEPGEKTDNRGGDWKISGELWDMIEQRMTSERRKTGRLTFERFSADIRAGRNGEKRKYDRWIMTTFEAVSAHWPRQPKPPRSTQRSKKPRGSIKTSSIVGHSSPPVIDSSQGNALPISSPIKAGDPTLPLADINADIKPDILAIDGHESPMRAAAGHVDPNEPILEEPEGIEEFSDSDDDVNPFEAFAMTQASQGAPDIKADINKNMISRAAAENPEDVDEEELAMQQHERDARQRAEEGVRFRATQMPSKADDSDEYDDDELDELFRRTVAGGWSTQTTPKKRTGAASAVSTSATASSRNTVGSEARRERHALRVREEAGLGDLSSIIDRSSVSLSPSNPFDPLLQTPTKPRTPVSDKATPTSLVRNLFARPRPPPTPAYTPSRHHLGTPANTVVLTPTKRSLGNLSPSPEEEEREVTPTPTKPKRPRSSYGHTGDVKPKLEELITPEAELGEIEMPLPHQNVVIASRSTVSSKSVSGKSVSAPSGPSPTLRNESPTPHDASTSQKLTSSKGISLKKKESQPKKRVRMASPESELGPITASQQSQPSQHSQVAPSSAETLNSTHTAISHQTDTSNSTLPPHFSRTSWQFNQIPPLARDVMETIEPQVVYTEPYYSNPVDVPPRAKMFAGRMFTLKGNTVLDLQEFRTSHQTPDKSWLKTRKTGQEHASFGWEFATPPPRRAQVVDWCEKEDGKAAAELARLAKLTSQLEGPTQRNPFGFKFSQKRKTRDSEREHQNMSVLGIEVFAKSRHQLLPDPEKDEITAVFYCYQNEDDSLPDTTTHSNYHAGYVVVDSPQIRNGRLGVEGVPCHVVDSELELINWMIDTVKHWDPDVLAGWELHNSSWGYLSSRAHEAFNVDLMEQLSRVVSGHSAPKKDFYSATHSSTFKVSGRHILNIWRICRSEINLTQYTFENVVFHFLQQRIPHYSSASLTALWKSKTPEHTARVIKYFFQRVVIDMEVVDAAEIITKNAEFARVFGVDFASVMFRGSQYKVESFMFRIAKPESFVLVSPSKQQVGLQNAPFAVPLIAEPESKYYNHPILVLDFQSLYPSVMIAYNICFSTCLGRVEKFKGTDKFGFTELKVADGLLELLKDYLTVTPNGMIFVKPAVRKSLLAKMLGEILDTRVMVKQAMKGARGDKSLLSLLNARQLGLKLMANVTYGYTSATYSGRMPCIEVADSIVQTGRETLEKAQELIHSRPEWAAQVVYGDTDSLFVALPGRSKQQAFVIGNAIADAVTAMNPKPVKLKFEKVYMGSVLMAKKRYVGFKYEHPDDVEPVFDAKGIETIRRDGFPAQQKIEEVCLKLLFRTQDLSQIKEYCRQEWTKILQGRVSLQDFIVAKEVRLGSYSDKGVPPPGAAVAYRRILKDPRDEPQYAERVPYIVSNADGRRLIDRARMPQEMLGSRNLGIDAEYYIRNLLIPPLSRIFNLVGADVEGWYDSMPRTKRAGRYDNLAKLGAGKGKGKMRIDSHFLSSHCIVCGTESADRICGECTADPATTAHALLSRQHLAQSKLISTHKICASCCNIPPAEKVLCDSIDCPVLYARVAAERDVDDLADIDELVTRLKDEPEGTGGLDW